MLSIITFQPRMDLEQPQSYLELVEPTYVTG